MADVDDRRTVSMVIRQWEKLARIKGQMVKAGIVGADASPGEVLEALRKQMPRELFAS